MIITTDPIADMLTRIRNAGAVRQQTVSLPHSKVKEAVAKLLVEKGFVDKVEIEKSPETFTNLVITLSQPNTNSRITKIERLSKPGRRTYAKVKDIPTVMRGRGLVIVSTSKGIMTGDQARKEGLGGELICKVY